MFYTRWCLPVISWYVTATNYHRPNSYRSHFNQFRDSELFDRDLVDGYCMYIYISIHCMIIPGWSSEKLKRPQLLVIHIPTTYILYIIYKYILCTIYNMIYIHIHIYI